MPESPRLHVERETTPEVSNEAKSHALRQLEKFMEAILENGSEIYISSEASELLGLDYQDGIDDQRRLLERWHGIIEKSSVEERERDFVVTPGWVTRIASGSYPQKNWSISSKLSLYKAKPNELNFVIEQLSPMRVSINSERCKLDIENIMDVIRSNPPLKVEHLASLSHDAKEQMIAFTGQIRDHLEKEYADITCELLEEAKKIAEVLNALSHARDEVLSSVIHLLHPSIRGWLRPYLKQTVGEVIDILQRGHYTLDKKRFDLHRRIESFRFLFENGVSIFKTGADLDCRIRQQRKETCDLGLGIKAFWDNKPYGFGSNEINDNVLVVTVGAGERYTFGDRWNDIMAPKPLYESFLGPKRSRSDDIALLENLSAKIRGIFPLIRTLNNLTVTGSFHENFCGNEFVIDHNSIAQQAESMGVSVKEIRERILALIKEEIASLAHAPNKTD